MFFPCSPFCHPLARLSVLTFLISHSADAEICLPCPSLGLLWTWSGGLLIWNSGHVSCLLGIIYSPKIFYITSKCPTPFQPPLLPPLGLMLWQHCGWANRFSLDVHATSASLGKSFLQDPVFPCLSQGLSTFCHTMSLSSPGVPTGIWRGRRKWGRWRQADRIPVTALIDSPQEAHSSSIWDSDASSWQKSTI